MGNPQLEILTAKEVASLLKIRISTVYELAEEGKIPGRRVIGKFWRFHRDTLLKWVAGELSLKENEKSGSQWHANDITHHEHIERYGFERNFPNSPTVQVTKIQIVGLGNSRLSMENDQQEFLNVKEAALLLRIKQCTFYDLAEQGKIPSRKVGKHWRFHRDTLLMWISGESPFLNGEVQGN